jgi:hypothetical protein
LTNFDQSAAFADTDFSDDDLDFVDVFDSDDDGLDSAAGFDSLAAFDDVSLDDDAVVPPFAAGAVADADESESVVLGVLFFA